MRVNRVIAMIVILCMLISLAGCKSPISMVKSLFGDDDEAASTVIESTSSLLSDEQLRDTVLYYKDDKGFLIPVMRKIPWTEGIAKATLGALVDNPANRQDIEGVGLIPVIPANTNIIGMDIENGLCKVDFTGDFLNYSSKEEEEALVKSVVYTLTEFVTIDSVQLMVEGKVLDNLVYGTNTQKAITRDNINYVSAEPSENTVVVYFEGTTNGLETYFVPVTKAIDKELSTGVNVLDAVDALVEGPPEGSGLFSEIPSGTKVVSVDVNGGIAYINLTEEILDIVDNQQMIDSVASAFGLTVKEQYSDVVGVKLFVKGKELQIGKESKEEPATVPTFANQY